MTDTQVKAALDRIQADLDNFTAGARGQLGEYKSAIGALQSRLEELGKQGGVTRLGFNPGETIARKVEELKSDLFRNGRVRFEMKSLLAETKALVTSSGITNPSTVPTIGDSGRPAYGAVRRMLPSVPISAASAFRVKETAHSFEASPQVEGEGKAECGVTLTGETINVRTIACWVPVTRQALDGDVEGLGAFLNSSLTWALEKRVEEELLSGSGTGENLEGLITNGQVFDGTILGSGPWNYADVLAASSIQLLEGGFNASFFVVSPRDWYALETLKDSEGRYILGFPREAFQAALWGRPVIPSPAMATGDFCAVDASRNIIRQRQEATIDVSESHDDFFVKNKVAIRVEERLALVTMHGSSVVEGTFSTSP